MKTNLACKIYKCLFRILPFPAWQAHWLDKHFTGCPYCREEVAAGEQVKELFVSLEDVQPLPGVWPYLNRHMEDTADRNTGVPVPAAKTGPGFFPGWGWKTAAVGLVLLLMLVSLPFLLLKKTPTRETHQEELKAGDKVVVKSVKIGSEAAKFYFFQSKDPDKLIVWAEKR
jgi:hypothetical protein